MKVAAILLVLTFFLLVALAIHLMWRARPELDGMSDDELLDAAYDEAEWGKFPNKYSREHDRRMFFGRATSEITLLPKKHTA